MNIKNGDVCFSLDGEHFNDDWERIEELKSGEKYYKAITREIRLEDLIDVDSILEYMQERAGEECGDASEDYLMDLFGNQKHKDELLDLICNWFKLKEYQPNFYAVDDIEELIK